MAEFEEIFEGIEEGIEEAEEGIEELSAEERAEVEAEIAETRTVVEELSTTQSKLQEFLSSLKSWSVKLANFTVKNIAIGAILWGVNVALNKLLPRAEHETKTRMRAVIKALSDVIKAESTMNKKVLDWMKAHEDDIITLDGMDVPMEAILTKYISPISKATDEAKVIVDSLQEKADGKVQFKCPTADNMRKFMEVIEVFIKAYTDLITFIKDHEQQVKELQSFPVKLEDLINISAQLKIAKDLPLW